MAKNTFYSSVLDEYSLDFLTENGYNKCYFEAKQDNELPSLYLISFLMVSHFLLYKETDKYPDDACISRILKKCRKVNSLKIELAADGSWNKQLFFNFVKIIVEEFAQSEFECCDYESADLYKKHLLNLFRSTTGKSKKLKKAAFPMFDDIVGLEKAKQVVKERIIDPTLHKEIFDKYGVQVGGGILLFGLPGTGKTMFAQAVANEIEGHFINIKSSDVKSKWFGETENRIKEIFEEAQKHKVAVIFFDEFEAIGVSRDKLGSEITASSVVPELLAQLQGFQKRKNIMLVIAATNRPWDIDSALLRPGRLDALVYVDLPNYDARKLMLEKYLSRIQIEDDIVEYIARYTEGYNGSDMKGIADNLVRKIINKAIENISNYEITLEDCIEIIKENKSSVVMKDIQSMAYFLQSQKM